VMLLGALCDSAARERIKTHLSPTNSNLRVFGGGGGRNWPSVEKERSERLPEGVQPDNRDSVERVTF
jgi:hypothetical protein